VKQVVLVVVFNIHKEKMMFVRLKTALQKNVRIVVMGVIVSVVVVGSLWASGVVNAQDGGFIFLPFVMGNNEVPGQSVPPALSTINDRAGFRRPTVESLQLEGDLRGDVETRASFGLDSSVDLINNLRGTPQDVGTSRYGFPLTQEELTDLEARFAFASATRTTVIPFAEGLSTFAGAFYNHQADGELVILLTEAPEEIRSEIASLAPAGGVTRIETVSHTQAHLRQALAQVREKWNTLIGPEAYAIAVDTPANAVRIDVDPAEVAAAELLLPQLNNVLNVPVFFGISNRPQDTACNNKEDCTGPMRAGIVIRRGSTTSSDACTMGFHIEVGSDIQFVTAGHCGYSGSNDWYHAGYSGNGGCGTGCVGSELSSQYINGGRDIMRVQMPDVEASSELYAGTVAVNTTLDPYVGQALCSSRGFSDPSWKCGAVDDDYLSWTSNTCNCTMYGADSSMTFIGGDSGSPIIDGYDQYIAIGIQNNSVGNFAIFDDTGYQIKD